MSGNSYMLDNQINKGCYAMHNSPYLLKDEFLIKKCSPYFMISNCLVIVPSAVVARII